jgi:hypothetical protein
MENYVTCPHCQRTISNDPIIDDAATGAGSAARSITCECGERISYWTITAQLRKQKTVGSRVQKWFRSFSTVQD